MGRSTATPPGPACHTPTLLWGSISRLPARRLGLAQQQSRPTGGFELLVLRAARCSCASRQAAQCIIPRSRQPRPCWKSPAVRRPRVPNQHAGEAIIAPSSAVSRKAKRSRSESKMPRAGQLCTPNDAHAVTQTGTLTGKEGSEGPGGERALRTTCLKNGSGGKWHHQTYHCSLARCRPGRCRRNKQSPGS